MVGCKNNSLWVRRMPPTVGLTPPSGQLKGSPVETLENSLGARRVPRTAVAINTAYLKGVNVDANLIGRRRRRWRRRSARIALKGATFGYALNLRVAGWHGVIVPPALRLRQQNPSLS